MSCGVNTARQRVDDVARRQTVTVRQVIRHICRSDQVLSIR